MKKSNKPPGKQQRNNQNVKCITKHDLQLISAEKIIPHPNNSKKHPQKQIEKIADSFRKFGMNGGLLVRRLSDGKFQIIAGHGRFEAAKLAGIEYIPVIVVNHLSDAEVRAYMIMDNKIAEFSDWDETTLGQEFSFLIQEEFDCNLDFSLNITGFETAEIDKLTSLLPKTDNNLEEAEISILSNEDRPLVSKSGDLWLLGKHKIYCGDATQKESYKKLMGSAKARILCSDCPYNIEINGFATGNGVKKHEEFKQASGEMSSEQFTHFQYQYLLLSCECLEDGALAYLWMDWRHCRETQDAAHKAKLKQLNLGVWDKQTGSMGSLYRSQHELIFIYKHGTKSHTNNIMLGRYGRNRGNVWYHPGANRSGEGKKALKNHPTPKPIPLIMDIILDASKPGDIILDPFLGSGTSILAATKTNRLCYGIEIEPKYVDLAIRRWQELTGEQAVHAETGKTFSEHEKGQYRVRERSIKKGGSHVQ